MSGAKVPLASRPLLFMALQTTGPDPLMHEVIELAAVRVHPQLLFVQREVTTRVRPQHPERCSVTAVVKGFDPEKWDEYPDVYDAMKLYAPLVDGCVLVAHEVNVVRAFLASAFRRAGLEPVHPEHAIDTASLAWPLGAIGALESMSLSSVARAFDLKAEDSLSARADVATTLEVYRRLMAGRLAVTAAPPAFEGDEDAILAALAARLTEGKSAYGAWRVNDGRNNPGEALLEVLDALNYCAAQLVKLARSPKEER